MIEMMEFSLIIFCGSILFFSLMFGEGEYADRRENLSIHVYILVILAILNAFLPMEEITAYFFPQPEIHRHPIDYDEAKY